MQPRSPDKPPIEHNPLYKLAYKAWKGRLTPTRALKMAKSEKFLAKIQETHYLQIVEHMVSSGLRLLIEPLPPLLPEVIWTSAAQKGIKGQQRVGLTASCAALWLMRLDMPKVIECCDELRKEMPELSGPINWLLDIIAILFWRPPNTDATPSDDEESTSHRIRTSDEREQEVAPNFWHLVDVFSEGPLDGPEGNVSLKDIILKSGVCSEEYLSYFLVMLACLRSGSLEELIELAGSAESYLTEGPPELVTAMEFVEKLVMLILGDFPQEAESLDRLIASSGQTDPNAFKLKLVGEGSQARFCIRIPQEELASLEVMGQVLERGGQLFYSALLRHIIALLLQISGEDDRAIETALLAKSLYEKLGFFMMTSDCDRVIASALKAKGCYEQALQVLSQCYETEARFGLGFTRFLFLMELDDIRHKMNDLNGARRALVDATELLEEFRHTLVSDHLRTSFFQWMSFLYLALLELCVEQGDYSGALTAVECMKARSLLELIDRSTQLPADGSDKENNSLESTLLAIRAYGSPPSHSKDENLTNSWHESVIRGRRSLQEFHELFRHAETVGASSPDSRFNPEDLDSILPDEETALVILSPLGEKTLAFVAKKGRPLSDTTIVIEDYGWTALTAEAEYLGIGSSTDMKRALDETLSTLHSKIFLRIRPLLTDIKRIIFLPGSGFRLLPLHAMYWGEDIGREYVTDYFVVSYAPSLRILRHCLNKKTRETNKVLIAHADSENGGSLLFSRREAISLARLYGVSPTLGITRRDLIQEAKHANLIHYTGHADLEGLDVRSEGDSKRGKFSAPDLIMDLAMPDARLAIMSACETGKALLGLTDEYLTPADAFLCKGAKTVVSSLWAVPEVTTCMLMWKMHESLLKGTGTAKSLQEAQRWLRQSNLDQRVSLLKEFGFRSENPKVGTSSANTGFTRETFRVEQLLPEDVSHPYYWAGFICTGAP